MLRLSAKTRKYGLSLVLVLSFATLLFPSSLVAAATSSANGDANMGGVTTTGYTVPAGTIQPLLFQTGAQGPLAELVFVFGGNSDDLRIRRVIESPPGIDFEFAGATPNDATRYFLSNPIPSQSPDFVIYVIYVENLGDKDQHLQITARWK